MDNKPLTEEQVRAIVREEMRANYMSGSPDIPPHEHNGTDNFNIQVNTLEGWTPIPVTSSQFLNQETVEYEFGFGSPAVLAGGDGSHASQSLHNTKIYQYPIPIVQGNGVGTQSAFEGGYAPDGTLVFFDNATISHLYIRSNGVWRGVNFDAVI